MGICLDFHLYFKKFFLEIVQLWNLYENKNRTQEFILFHLKLKKSYGDKNLNKL